MIEKEHPWNAEGAPAFPVCDEMSGYFFKGLSKRDYFAAKAMQGMLSNGFVPSKSARFGTENHEMYAEQAYKIADAMLAERDKP